MTPPLIPILAKIRTILLLVAFVAVDSVHAQTPTGTIAGNVTDHTGAAVARSRITITSRATGLSRKILTSEEGYYSAAALLPGDYQIIAETAGFTLLERSATVETGTTTTVNLQLHVDAISETVSVETAAPLLRYEHHQVGGLVSRKQIEDLPINGRNYLELVKLEPGVQAPTRASSNRTFVPALGQPLGNSGRGTRVTVDGGSVMAVGNGGSAMGFSQEVVQEFQIATVNFDLTMGLTNGAAINVTTRSGGNDLHGTGFYFFRDHTLDAYPALKRDDTNPSPFFQRRQFGFALGGPIRRDRFFFFGAYERNEQRGVVATTILLPEFAHFNRITPSPYTGNQLSLRVDGRLSDAHNAFIRYSHDGARGVGPTTTQLQMNAYPSSWTRQSGLADQGVVGLTSVFSETLVNDLRFSYLYAGSSQLAVTEQECPGCLGVGAPSINVQGGISVGGSLIQQTAGRRFHLNDYATWQRLGHRFRFGVDWEHNRGGTVTSQHEPATLTLYSPERAPEAGISPPSAFRTLDDILQLPLQSVTVGIGNPRVLQENGSLVRSWDTLRLFLQDNWRLTSRINVNYGLGWNIDRNLNYDLDKPALLAPLLGGDNLGPTRKKWNNFSPVLGLVWSPDKAAKTVIRAGAGLFYDFLFQGFLDSERALLGPPGSGRQNISGNRLLNCLQDIAGVPVAAPLNFPTPTRFTGANLLTCLPTIRAGLEQSLANVDQSIQRIQLTKQSSNLNPVDVSSPRSLHLNLGIQRAIMQDFVVGADFVYRRFTHFALVDRTGVSQVDLNHFNSTRGPVIPECLTDAQRNDPHALCSTGPIVVHQGVGRATYTGLLVRADKRFSHGFQLLGSWAYSSNTGTNVGNGFNIDDWLSNRGPLDRDVTHIVNLAGVVKVPWRFQLGFNFSYASTPPFSAFVEGIDFNGDGTKDDLLPGTTVNAFNRSMGRSDLERLVTQFNETYAGKIDENGSLIRRVTLPERYSFGDNFQSLDLRLSREFVIRERWRVILIGEVFNLYNAANLSGYSGNLTSTVAFGQPTGRFTQVFGSGGPRAFQLGARVSF